MHKMGSHEFKGKYKVVVSNGGRYAYADTLAAAKQKGERLGRLTERNDSKWNISHVRVDIFKAASPWYFDFTGWMMAVPVRGTGKRRADVVADIKRHYGVPPYHWMKSLSATHQLYN